MRTHTDETLLLGAVAYDPKVVTIWEGFRTWLREHGCEIDYVLYSNYERQVEDLVAGRLHAAWNSPLGWVRTRRLLDGQGVWPLVMRDTDCDLSSVVVVRADSDITEPGDLAGRTVATGAVDSPQATLIPLSHLRSLGLRPEHDIKVRRFDIGVGLHGDHIGGERDAAQALVSGLVDAACLVDVNHQLFAREGTFRAGAVRILTETDRFDHCNLTVTAGAPRHTVEHLSELLRSMSYADPEVRPLLDLEGLKVWEPGRTEGYPLLERAVDELGFYDKGGNVIATDYRP